MKNQEKPPTPKSTKKHTPSTPNKVWQQEQIKNLDESSMQAAQLFKALIHQQEHVQLTDDQHIHTQRIEQKSMLNQAQQEVQDTQYFCQALQKNHLQAKFDVIMPPFGQFSVKTHQHAQGLNFMIYDASAYTKAFIAQHHQSLCASLGQELQKNVDISVLD